jgi:predicted RNA-binding protein with PUA-like domain
MDSVLQGRKDARSGGKSDAATPTLEMMRVDNPVWFLVDVCFEEKFPRLISLAELRAQPALEGMALLKKGQRLSVMPIEPAHFAHILALTG